MVQAATGDAIVDCIIEGILPKDGLDELCMIIMIWLDQRCAEDDNLDQKDLYRTKLRGDEARIALAPPQGRADGGRADRQPEDREALRLDGVIEY